jgi:hypothetical protein
MAGAGETRKTKGRQDNGRAASRQTQNDSLRAEKAAGKGKVAGKEKARR